MDTQQQIDQAQNNRLEELEKETTLLKRKTEIGEYIDGHTNDKGSPGQYGKALVESLKNRFTDNIAIWKIVLADVSSGYMQAYNHFEHVKKIMDQDILARQKMVATILGAYASMGLGWSGLGMFGPIVKETVKQAVSGNRPETAEAFFSPGFEEIVKSSGITFDGLPKVHYDRKEDLVEPTIDLVLLPGQFDNELEKSFDRCVAKVTAQLNYMIGELDNSESVTNKDIQEKFGDFMAEARTDTPLDQIYSRIDKACATIKNMVRNMNEHLIKTAFYYRIKPKADLMDDEKADQEFITRMAGFFERAMWAGWIAANLKEKKWMFWPGATHFGHNGLWFWNSPRKYKQLKPGRYMNVNGGYDVQVYIDYHKPSGALVDRLEALQVIETQDNGPVDKATLTKEQIAQVENLGHFISEQDIRSLVDWAEKECLYLSPYGMSDFPFIERDTKELWLDQLS